MTGVLPSAIVLAGGRGTRLRPVTGDRYPKPMVPTPSLRGDVPFLEWPLAWLRREGVRDAVICTGHLGEQIERRFGGACPRGLTITFDFLAEADTGARCRSAFGRIAGDVAVVICGDVHVDFPLEPLAAELQALDECDALVACVLPIEGDPANLVADASGLVTAYDQAGLEAPDAVLDAGVIVLRRSALDGHAEGAEFSLAGHVYPRLIARGRLRARRVQSHFFDIGTPEGYARFCARSAAADPEHGLIEKLAACG